TCILTTHNIKDLLHVIDLILRVYGSCRLPKGIGLLLVNAFKPSMNSNRWGISTSIRRSRTRTELLANLGANLGKQCLQGILNGRRKVGALPPPDYVPGPEEPEQAPPTPVYIAYVPELDLEENDDEDPEEDPADYPADHDDEDPEEDPADYPADHDDEDPEEDPTDYPADHDDEEQEVPSGDDTDEEDEEQDEDDDDDEEEHPASADSIPPPPALCVTARISFRPQPLTLSFIKEDAERFLAMPNPPPSPLTPLSSSLPQIPSPPLPASPLILPIPLPAASPPLQLLSSNRRADRPEVTLPPRKRLIIVHCPGYEVGESSVAAVVRPIECHRADYGFVDSVEAEIRRRRAEDIGYGIRDTWIDPRDVDEEEALTTLEGVNPRGHLATALGEIRALQAREQARGHLATALGEIRALQSREQARVDFMKCSPITFRGNEGVVGLIRWIEKTEMVFTVRKCTEANKVVFATATFQDRALTWWNSQVATSGIEVVPRKTWAEMKVMMKEECCPPEEIKRMEGELWNLRVKEMDISSYTTRFNELVILCTGMVLYHPF
nr:hypothetical protein [Tanacetum cinerariifolium]